ncbi:MAG TPA: DUF4255 domain-containing protein [Kofleriaceae bacterium]
MPLPETSLSRACRSIADLIQSSFAAANHPIQVRLGTPASAQPAATDTEHRLNLFFHRFEPSGFGSFELPNETWRIRVYCVITAFAVDEDRISAGENDLRLIGEVLRLFHEDPVLAPVDVGGEQMQAQMILQPLGLDQIFQLWQTQGDVPYRPSLAYQVALVPILPKQPAIGGPLVGAIGTEVRPRLTTEPPSTTPRPALSEPRRIDTRDPEWAPQIAFVSPAGLVESLSLPLGSPELAVGPSVCIAGDVGTAVTLTWEVWDSVAGWRPGGTDQPATVEFAQLPDDSATGVRVQLPSTTTAGQSVLYATRHATRSDGAAIVIRSNPLLVTLFRGSP